MERYRPPREAAAVLVLGHGAGAGEGHPWMRRVGEALASRGVEVITFDFPYMAAGRRVPDPGPILEKAYAEVWHGAAAAAAGRLRLFAGGKSMGGRIASQAAAKGLLDPAPGGLVFFGYPLHPPGKPDQRRDRHLPAIGAPLLFLQGTRDPFASPDEMRDLVSRLPRAALEIIDGGDHSLETRKRGVAGPSGVDRAVDLAARWMTTL